MNENRLYEWGSFQRYLNGYRNSILVLLKKLSQDSDLIFPITFLIAQFLELEIKYLNLNWGNVFFESYTIKSLGLDQNHSLLELFEASIEEWLLMGVTETEVESLKELINYYECFKQNKSLSESMRFPVDVYGNYIFNRKVIDKFSQDDILTYLGNTNKLLNLLLIIELKEHLYNQNDIKLIMNHINKYRNKPDNDIKEIEEIIHIYQRILADVYNNGIR